MRPPTLTARGTAIFLGLIMMGAILLAYFTGGMRDPAQPASITQTHSAHD